MRATLIRVVICFAFSLLISVLHVAEEHMLLQILGGRFIAGVIYSQFDLLLNVILRSIHCCSNFVEVY